jgi:GST-like protein
LIEFHYVHTPNARKVRIMLAETALAYRRIDYDVRAGDHLRAGFRLLNPNNKLPVIRDLAPAGGSVPITVFESGAILIYLAEKTGHLLPTDTRLRTLAFQWLMWQMAGLGPMGGQMMHFMRYAPAGQDYAQQRYGNEVFRLANVLEYRLAEAEYLAEDYSIADIATWPLANLMATSGFDMAAFPCIQRWIDAIAARPAVQEAMIDDDIPQRLIDNPADLSPDERSILFGERQTAAALASNRGQQ